MGEMKSAFEKAMEKADRLGSLSPGEMREREEVEETALGRAIAGRYLDHGYKRLLEEEVGRYSGDDRDVVMGAALSRLVEAIDCAGGEQTEGAEKALEGLLALKGRGQVGETVDNIRGVLGEIRDAEQQAYHGEKERIEKGQRELLHRLRIAGSAVGAINPGSGEARAAISREVELRFSERLGALKRELLSPGEEG